MLTQIQQCKMDRVIWMIWFQGLDHHSFDEIHRVCLDQWINLNKKSDWSIRILTDNNIDQFEPEYNDILTTCKHKRNLQSKSDLLRLMILKRYGGVYVDFGVYPFLAADQFIDKIDNGSDLFMLKWPARQCSVWGDRDVSSSFIWSKKPNNYVITEWLKAYKNSFLNLNPWKYYTVHHVLTELYDNDKQLKKMMDAILPVDGETIGSTRERWSDYKPGGFMYKRGKQKHPAVEPPWGPPDSIKKLWE